MFQPIFLTLSDQIDRPKATWFQLLCRFVLSEVRGILGELRTLYSSKDLALPPCAWDLKRPCPWRDRGHWLGSVPRKGHRVSNRWICHPQSSSLGCRIPTISAIQNSRHVGMPWRSAKWVDPLPSRPAAVLQLQEKV